MYIYIGSFSFVALPQMPPGETPLRGETQAVKPKKSMSRDMAVSLLLLCPPVKPH